MKNVVVEIGDYNPAYTGRTVPTGAGLQQETQWFQKPRLDVPWRSICVVQHGKRAERHPCATATGKQQAVYSAVRGAGSNAMIGMENTQWPGGSSASINPSEYAGMNNVFLDVHYYNWLSGYSTSVSANAAALQAEVKTSLLPMETSRSS